MENRRPIKTYSLPGFGFKDQKVKNYYKNISKKHESLPLYSSFISSSSKLFQGAYYRQTTPLLAAKLP